MTPPLTYLEFLALFVLVPIVALLAAAVVRERAWLDRRAVGGVAIMIGLAVVYTTPWDNLLIDRGVWWYGEGVVAVQLWHAPLGEYLFFVLQPILTALWLYQFLGVENESLAYSLGTRFVGAVAGLAVSAVGVWLLVTSSSTLYLGATLLWAGPILAIQWAFGWPYLWRTRRTVALGVFVPTVYLWVVDRFAIDQGLWIISSEYTVGVSIAGLPLEEAVFFLLTNVFVVQGLVLYRWLLASLDDRGAESATGTSSGDAGTTVAGDTSR